MSNPLPFRPVTPDTRPLRVGIFGAAPATGNLGVTALCHALVAGIARRDRDADVTVFDDRPGVRPATVVVDDREHGIHLCGAIPTRRLHRRDSLWRLRVESRYGFRGGRGVAPALDAIRRADVVLDVTGGDSFTDLYGARRFARGLHEKRLVLDQGRPLVLAPQTIGPFGGARARRAAAAVLGAASMVWCRDAQSLTTLRELVGPAFDAERHRLGVDVAFALPARAPQRPLPEPARGWLGDLCPRPTVGLNVSGLLLNDERHARRRFGLSADYRAVVSALLARVLDATDHNVLIIPHVVTRPGHHEHDPDAGRVILASVDPAHRTRVAIAEGVTDPAEAKWMIARCAWVCATRMHAAIAALSSGIPAGALAYSDKPCGVFAQCGLGAHVADLRRSGTDAVVDCMWHSFTHRHGAHGRLARRLPGILERAETQLDAMIGRHRRDRDAEPTRRRAA